MTAAEPRAKRARVAVAVIGCAAVIGVAGGLLIWHADREVNRSTLAEVARPVAYVVAQSAAYRRSRTYVGTIQPWIEARIGPQYISAYVETVRVRPGDSVKLGDVVATLDCSNPQATQRAAEMQARSIVARQKAIADEADRVRRLADQGFAAANESEQKLAQSEAESSRALEASARAASARLGVKDCVLTAPFDGEIATRVADPGAFVRPGEPIISIVDRSTDRVTLDVPEKDFELLPVGTEVRIDVLSTGARVTAKVSRRAPKADPATRTVHVEIDVPDPARSIPVGTTAIVHVEVGRPVAASALPAYAATVHDDKASVFVIDGGVVHRREIAVVGELGGTLYVDTKDLPPGAHVVSEGRALLEDGTRVDASQDAPPPARAVPAEARGAGHGRPL